MSGADDALAYGLTEALLEGRFDDHLSQIAQAVAYRRAVTDHTRVPKIWLPEGQVWVWMNEPVNRWEPRGTGVVL